MLIYDENTAYEIVSLYEKKALRTIGKSKFAELTRQAERATPSVPAYLEELEAKFNIEADIACKHFLYVLKSYNYAVFREGAKEEPISAPKNERSKSKSKTEPKIQEGHVLL